MEEKQLYHFDIEFDENVVTFSRNLMMSILDCLEDEIHYVEFYNSLNTIEDLEELGVAPNYFGNPLESYLEFLSNENLILDPVVTKYGIPLEMGYTYLFEGIQWLTPTIVYKFDFVKVLEKVRTADVFYLKTPNDPDLNPYSPRFFCKEDDNIPMVWIDNESILLSITSNQKLQIELACDIELTKVEEENSYFSSPETQIIPFVLGVNN